MYLFGRDRSRQRTRKVYATWRLNASDFANGPSVASATTGLFLSHNHVDMVEKAKADAACGRATAPGVPVPVGKVVAELRLGFWTGLVAAGYEQSLWHPCLKKAFPNSTLQRKEVYRFLDNVKSVRNRVAHHERILGSHGSIYAGLDPFRRTELKLHPEAILNCVAWICPATSNWIRATTRFEDCPAILGSAQVKDLHF